MKMSTLLDEDERLVLILANWRETDGTQPYRDMADTLPMKRQGMRGGHSVRCTRRTGRSSLMGTDWPDASGKSLMCDSFIRVCEHHLGARVWFSVGQCPKCHGWVWNVSFTLAHVIGDDAERRNDS